MKKKLFVDRNIKRVGDFVDTHISRTKNFDDLLLKMGKRQSLLQVKSLQSLFLF